VDDPTAREPTIGWLRAGASTLLIAVVAIGVLVYGTNAVLNRLTGIDRGQRVAIATTLFFVALFALAWALRRLQQRHVI
jgi:hypothetical protein